MNIKYNKYNLDPNVVKCGGCSKPAQLRRGDGKVVSAYREVEEDYGMPSHHLVDNDNPSVDGVMFNPQAKRECSEREREGERLIENMKLGKYLGGLRVKKDNNDNQDNSPKSNPAASTPQPITNSNDKNDNSVGSVNAPPSSSEPKNSSEIKISPKPVGESKDNPREKLQNETEKGNNQTPVINLKDIKKISLVGDNLVIEFNQSEKRQTVVSEQITNNQELSAVKNYLRKNNQTSLSQQELNKIFSKENNRVASTKKSPELNNALLIGGGVTVNNIQKIQKPIATMKVQNNEKVSRNKEVIKEEEFIVKPIHPGTILREGLLIPQDISPQELAQAIKVPKEQIK
ncbi:6542_t:CDS:2 [Funneliformis geosporum]|uniref:6542_t:CDS:1 n=1 Tax=Funneliformis geosporum TaxID=1117311 RepID=A0A9W4T4N6_9GLOM|nr:6542_t:CDS:2 [Funneliformis geosporum]